MQDLQHIWLLGRAPAVLGWLGRAGAGEATVLPRLGFLFCLWNSELDFSEGSKSRTHRASEVLPRESVTWDCWLLAAGLHLLLSGKDWSDA